MSRSLFLKQLYEDDLAVQKVVNASKHKIEITEKDVPLIDSEFRRVGRTLEGSKICRFTQRHPNTGNIQRIRWNYTNVLDVAKGKTPFLYPAQKQLPAGSMRVDCVFTPEMLKEIAYDLRETEPSKNQVRGWLERLILTYFDRRKPQA